MRRAVSDPSLIAWLAKCFAYTPHDRHLFELALTHRSASSSNYERLEFLGDAVLNLLASEMLYGRYELADEGDLSRLRARLVSEEPLAEMAAQLGIGDRLLLGSGELKSGGFRRQSILADALEALCGALFLDGGLDAARCGFAPLLAERIVALPDPGQLKDSKTRLQEYLQGRGEPIHSYTLERTEGEPHEQIFFVLCAVPSVDLITQGCGSSRRRAEQNAAQAALNVLDARR
jgi:ribonuclease-3